MKKVSSKKSGATCERSAVEKVSGGTPVARAIAGVTIEMAGDMYECMFLRISRSRFDDISVGGRDSDSWVEVEDDLKGESKIDGFVYTGRSASFSLLVDGVEQAVLVRRFLAGFGAEQSAAMGSKKPSPRKSYFIAFEKWCSQGRMHLTVNGYSPERLALTSSNVWMPDGTLRSVAECHYEGRELEFDGSWTREESVYLYCSDGTRKDL